MSSNSPRLSYTTREDSGTEEARRSLANVYAFVLDRYASKQAAGRHPSPDDPDDTEDLGNDRIASSSIPEDFG